jgi:hypothetical protein
MSVTRVTLYSKGDDNVEVKYLVKYAAKLTLTYRVIQVSGVQDLVKTLFQASKSLEGCEPPRGAKHRLTS